MKPKTPYGIYTALILGMGVVIRLLYIFSSTDSLIKIIPDDAFYYLKIAKNISLGLGSSFDEINPANGYHPLWMIILLPFAKLTTSPWLMVKITLFITVIFNTATAILLFRFLKEKTRNIQIANLGLFLYFLNHQVVVNSLNGLETGLATFILMALIFLIIGDKYNLAKSKNLAILGFLFGAAFLARTDLIFYLLPLFLITAFKIKKGWFKNSILLATAFFITISPWIFWNLAKFNTIFQTSANAVPFVLKQYFLSNNQDQKTILVNSLTLLGNFFINDFISILGLTYPLIVFILILLLGMAIRFGKEIFPNEKFKREAVSVLSLLLGGISLTLIHVFVRWYPRPWYFDQLILISVILISYAFFLAFCVVKDFRGSIVLKIATTIFVLLLACFNLKNVIHLNKYPHQTEMLKASKWLNTNTNKDEVSASFNSGIISYFSDRQVVNLDGVVNNEAYKAIKEHQLWQHINLSGAKYYVDYEPFMTSFYQQFMGKQFSQESLTLIKEINEPNVDWEKSTIKIFQIKR